MPLSRQHALEIARKNNAHLEDCFCTECHSDVLMIEQVARDTAKECAAIVAQFKPRGPDPIGPLHGAGIAAAANAIQSAIHERFSLPWETPPPGIVPCPTCNSWIFVRPNWAIVAHYDGTGKRCDASEKSFRLFGFECVL